MLADESCPLLHCIYALHFLYAIRVCRVQHCIWSQSLLRRVRYAVCQMKNAFLFLATAIRTRRPDQQAATHGRLRFHLLPSATSRCVGKPPTHAMCTNGHHIKALIIHFCSLIMFTLPLTVHVTIELPPAQTSTNICWLHRIYCAERCSYRDCGWPDGVSTVSALSYQAAEREFMSSSQMAGSQAARPAATSALRTGRMGATFNCELLHLQADVLLTSSCSPIHPTFPTFTL